ncbi:MAG TPA: sigma-70 family RNA polymerase sigma factor [Gemmataceae bacterium]|nr:sigma-70 family RNA polymerase sigma factor [Gemmataceae bacterium]
MSSSALAAGLRHLRRRLAAQQRCEDSDEQLLHAFTTRRDEAAFAVLVRRHGPMVLHVCRRVLGHEQDAEDAFQATFLVLAQNAAALRNKTALASFLHATAYRTAMKAKQAAVRRRKHEEQTPARPSANPADELLWREVRELLDEEIAHLPETYRSVFVLCCLEELSQEEAGRRLGLKQRTVSNRLAEARKRLMQRLARRGVELTALLGTAALAAPPAELMASTIEAALAAAAGQGLASIATASVAALVQSAAALVQSAAAAATLSKAKWAAVLLLAATLLAGAGAWTCRTLTTPQPAVPQAETPAPGRKAETPRQEKSDRVTVMGRVLGPDGKPVKGARLYWPRMPKTDPLSEDDIEFPQRATTDAEGRFHFELPRSDLRPTDWNLALIAAADGYGMDAVELPRDASRAEVTLRLVKDQPIDGHILSTEGKPLAGVRVRAFDIRTMKQGRLDDFLTAWKQVWGLALGQLPRSVFLPPAEKSFLAVTDKDGRFHISGAGCERLVQLRVSGPRVAHDSLRIINRAGFDAAAVNKAAVLDHMRLSRQPPLLYGPTFTYIASAGRRVEGTVREAGSGKPVAGFAVYCIPIYGTAVSAVSDNDGRYALDGVAKTKQYLFNVEPPAGSTWLPTGARRDDEEGLRPLHVDFTVARGIVVRGRVLERTTGKGVRGFLRFAPLPGNKFAHKPGFNCYHWGHGAGTRESDGRFQATVIPGPGVLMFQAEGTEKAVGGQELNPYKQAEFDAKDREHVNVTERGEDRYFTAIDNFIEYLNSLNAVKYLDLAADAVTAKCDLFVERGTTRTIRIEDPEGKPLTGTIVAGVTARYPTVYPIKDAACTIFTLDPKKPRRLFFFHTERNLAGSMTLRGDEKEPLTVRLVPAGSVTGRLLDRDGQPIAGAYVDLDTPEGTYGTARELYRRLQLRRPPIRTDKNGRFRIDGLVPDVKFMLSIYQGRTVLDGEPRIGERQVKPGETLDLGAVRVKAGR